VLRRGGAVAEETGCFLLEGWASKVRLTEAAWQAICFMIASQEARVAVSMIV